MPTWTGNILQTYTKSTEKKVFEFEIRKLTAIIECGCITTDWQGYYNHFHFVILHVGGVMGCTAQYTNRSLFVCWSDSYSCYLTLSMCFLIVTRLYRCRHIHILFSLQFVFGLKKCPFVSLWAHVKYFLDWSWFADLLTDRQSAADQNPRMNRSADRTRTSDEDSWCKLLFGTLCTQAHCNHHGVRGSRPRLLRLWGRTVYW